MEALAIQRRMLYPAPESRTHELMFRTTPIAKTERGKRSLNEGPVIGISKERKAASGSGARPQEPHDECRALQVEIGMCRHGRLDGTRMRELEGENREFKRMVADLRPETGRSRMP